MTQHALDVFQVIADPNRRYILELLTQENLSINALAENFDMSRPAVSKHIKALHTAGFISIVDIGRERMCMLNKEGFSDLQDWINYFDSFWKTKLKNLETLMNKRK